MTCSPIRRGQKSAPDINAINSGHVETVCLLVRKNGLHINIDVDVEEMLQKKTRTSRLSSDQGVCFGANRDEGLFPVYRTGKAEVWYHKA